MLAWNAGWADWTVVTWLAGGAWGTLWTVSAVLSWLTLVTDATLWTWSAWGASHTGGSVGVTGWTWWTGWTLLTWATIETAWAGSTVLAVGTVLSVVTVAGGVSAATWPSVDTVDAWHAWHAWVTWDTWGTWNTIATGWSLWSDWHVALALAVVFLGGLVHGESLSVGGDVAVLVLAAPAGALLGEIDHAGNHSWWAEVGAVGWHDWCWWLSWSWNVHWFHWGWFRNVVDFLDAVGGAAEACSLFNGVALSCEQGNKPNGESFHVLS